MNRNQHKMSYTIQESAEATGISPWTIRRMALKGLIGFSRFGKKILIPTSELERITAAGAVVSSANAKNTK